MLDFINISEIEKIAIVLTLCVCFITGVLACWGRHLISQETINPNPKHENTL
jgi:purine-cytosine permease-like protein